MSVEPNTRKKLFERNHSLDSYEVTNLDFVREDKVGEQDLRPTVYFNNLDGLIHTILQQRGYNLSSSHVLFKIGVDDGGGLSISSTDSYSDLQRKDTAVKIFVIGIVLNIQGSYANVLKMWHQVQLIGPHA